MIGDHCIAAIGDACIKDIRNFDIGKAYEAMRKNAFESPADEKTIWTEWDGAPYGRT